MLIYLVLCAWQIALRRGHGWGFCRRCVISSGSGLLFVMCQRLAVCIHDLEAAAYGIECILLLFVHQHHVRGLVKLGGELLSPLHHGMVRSDCCSSSGGRRGGGSLVGGQSAQLRAPDLLSPFTIKAERTRGLLINNVCSERTNGTRKQRSDRLFQPLV